MKRYNLRCNYCGLDHFVTWWWLVVRLVTLGSVRSQCKRCSRQSRYVLVSHVVHDADNTERGFNKEVERTQRRVREMRGLKSEF